MTDDPPSRTKVPKSPRVTQSTKTKTKSTTMKSNEVQLESRLTRIETQLDLLLDRLKELPQSPQCIEGINDLNRRMTLVNERIMVSKRDEDWMDEELVKIDQRLKNIETRTTYWMGSIAVMTPIALLALKAIVDSLFR